MVPSYVLQIHVCLEWHSTNRKSMLWWWNCNVRMLYKMLWGGTSLRVFDLIWPGTRSENVLFRSVRSPFKVLASLWTQFCLFDHITSFEGRQERSFLLPRIPSHACLTHKTRKSCYGSSVQAIVSAGSFHVSGSQNPSACLWLIFVFLHLCPTRRPPKRRPQGGADNSKFQVLGDNDCFN